MNDQNSQDGPTAAETLRGGLEITLQHLDGTRCPVFVRQVPLGEMTELLAAQGDEAKLACLYAGKDEALLEGLTLESQELLVTEGDRINQNPFSRWFRRRLARQERLVPGSTARIMEAFSPEADSSNSQPVRVVPAG